MTKPSKKLIDQIYEGFTDRSERGRAAALKGRVFERQVANVLKKIWPKAKRGLGQAREAHEVPDVRGTPFWVECADSGVSIQAKMRQAVLAARRHSTELSVEPPPIVISKKRGEILVTMRLDDWMMVMLKGWGKL